MKKNLKRRLLITAAILCGPLSFYFSTKKSPLMDTQCLVCKKEDVVENTKHKNVVSHASVFYLIVKTKYGYGRVPVTTDTFYTTKVGDNIIMVFKPREINKYFNKELEDNEDRNICIAGLLVILCGILGLILSGALK